MLSGRCDRVEIGTREWISILRRRLHTVHNTERPFCSMSRMNTAPNIDVWKSIKLKRYQAAISSPLQRLQPSINHPVIHMNSPEMIGNPWRLTMCMKRQADEVIVQHAYWPQPDAIRIRLLKQQRTGGKLIQISIITTHTQWRLAVHFGYQT
jgi:hypothetical protein